MLSLFVHSLSLSFHLAVSFFLCQNIPSVVKQTVHEASIRSAEPSNWIQYAVSLATGGIFLAQTWKLTTQTETEAKNAYICIHLFLLQPEKEPEEKKEEIEKEKSLFKKPTRGRGLIGTKGSRGGAAEIQKRKEEEELIKKKKQKLAW